MDWRWLAPTPFYLEVGAETARARSFPSTDAGRDKRAEAQRHWKAAQLALNETLGVERVLALHTLVDDSLDLLAALPAPEAGHDE